MLTAAVLVTVVLASEVAGADEKADAKKHFDIGVVLMNADDFEAAVTEFEESIRIYKTKSAIFNLANCYRALKKYGESLVVLKRLEREFGDKFDDEMRAAVATIRKEIKAMTATVKVTVDADGASVFVDGAVVGTSPMNTTLYLEPGRHEVRAELAGKSTPAEVVELSTADTKQVNLRFLPEPPPPPAPVPIEAQDTTPPPKDDGPTTDSSASTLKRWGHGLLWSGVALLIAGGVSTALAAEHGARVADPDNYDSEEERGLSRLWSGVMWTGYGAGLAFVATSIPLFVAAKRKESPSGVALLPLFDGRSAALAVKGEW